MRQVTVPTAANEHAFFYYCPICGIELTRSNYEALDDDYYCPYCSTQRRASRVPAGRA